jgi:hypothetical protein
MFPFVYFQTNVRCVYIFAVYMLVNSAGIVICNKKYTYTYIYIYM